MKMIMQLQKQQNSLFNIGFVYFMKKVYVTALDFFEKQIKFMNLSMILITMIFIVII